VKRLRDGKFEFMISQGDYNRLHKLLAMVGSDNEGETLNAVTAINRVLNTNALAWSDLLLPRKLLPDRVDPGETLLTEEEGGGSPNGLGDVNPAEMVSSLLASQNVSPRTKRDVRDFAHAVSSRRLTANIRAEIQAL